MRLGVALEEPDQPRGIGANQFEQIKREFRDTGDDLASEGMNQQRLDRSRMLRLELGQPVAKALFGGCGSGNMGSFREACGQTHTMRVRVSRRGEGHATFCGTSSIEGATLSLAPVRAGKTSVATRPGWASPNLSSPPCNIATADAKLSPRPEPGSVRLASRRTNRSTACLRSPSGIPGPWSVTLSST